MDTRNYPFQHTATRAILSTCIRAPSGNQMDEIAPKTLSVPEAGRWLGIKRNTAYAAVRNGEIPVIKIGKLLRVPVVALERMLEEARPRNEGGGNG